MLISNVVTLPTFKQHIYIKCKISTWVTWCNRTIYLCLLFLSLRDPTLLYVRAQDFKQGFKSQNGYQLMVYDFCVSDINNIRRIILIILNIFTAVWIKYHQCWNLYYRVYIILDSSDPIYYSRYVLVSDNI